MSAISSTKNLCSGFRPGLDRGTERDGFTQSGASMEDSALGCGNGNVQNLRCFLDGQFLKLGHFDDRAHTRAESTYGAVKNGSALALHIGLLRIWGTIRDLKMQSRFAGRGQLVRGNLARTTILAINHEGRIHDNAREPCGKTRIAVEVVEVHKGSHHRVLHSVFGVFAISCDTERDLE
jgi:hypothetical protein